MIKKFKVAFNGLFLAFKHPAVLIQLVLALCAIGGGLIIKLNYYEWLVFIICIGMVIMAEIFNTTIEKVCDLIDESYNEKIKAIKDMSSSAVLLISLTALVICIFVTVNKLGGFNAIR